MFYKKLLFLRIHIYKHLQTLFTFKKGLLHENLINVKFLQMYKQNVYLKIIYLPEVQISIHFHIVRSDFACKSNFRVDSEKAAPRNMPTRASKLSSMVELLTINQFTLWLAGEKVWLQLRSFIKGKN